MDGLPRVFDALVRIASFIVCVMATCCRLSFLIISKGTAVLALETFSRVSFLVVSKGTAVLALATFGGLSFLVTCTNIDVLALASPHSLGELCSEVLFLEAGARLASFLGVGSAS